MAPLSKAIVVQLASSREDVAVFHGNVDAEWTVGAVPNGGYVLALIMQACIELQSASAHPHPLHMSSHFLQATSVAEFEVHVRTVKKGKGFTNLTAELIQKGRVNVMSHLIFGNLTVSSEDEEQSLNLAPPSSYARRLPLYHHPSKAAAMKRPLRGAYTFTPRIKSTEEPEIQARNAFDSPTRTNSNTVGGDGLEWGTWFEFADEGERITTPSLAILLDVFLNLPSLLPKGETKGSTQGWYPTMTMAIDFKAPIPSPSKNIYADRTVGIYSKGLFMNDPQGRHDMYTEVWTAPSNIGEGEEVQGWRDKQVCLAVSTQMALTVSMEVNARKGSRGTKL